MEAYSDNKNQVKYDSLDKGIEEFLEIGNFQLNLIGFAEEYAEKYLNDVSHISQSWLSKFLNTARVNFNNLQVDFRFDELKQEFFERIKKYSLDMLVQAGLKVLITTHSPYIVDHLSNLMKAAKYEDKESLKERFYLERTEAFIPQDKVSVYLFEDGTAKNISHEDGRIDWGTFGNVSDDISHIFP